MSWNLEVVVWTVSAFLSATGVDERPQPTPQVDATNVGVLKVLKNPSFGEATLRKVFDTSYDWSISDQAAPGGESSRSGCCQMPGGQARGMGRPQPGGGFGRVQLLGAVYPSQTGSVGARLSPKEARKVGPCNESRPGAE